MTLLSVLSGGRGHGVISSFLFALLLGSILPTVELWAIQGSSILVEGAFSGGSYTRRSYSQKATITATGDLNFTDCVFKSGVQFGTMDKATVVTVRFTRCTIKGDFSSAPLTTKWRNVKLLVIASTLTFAGSKQWHAKFENRFINSQFVFDNQTTVDFTGGEALFSFRAATIRNSDFTFANVTFKSPLERVVQWANDWSVKPVSFLGTSNRINFTQCTFQVDRSGPYKFGSNPYRLMPVFVSADGQALSLAVKNCTFNVKNKEFSGWSSSTLEMSAVQLYWQDRWKAVTLFDVSVQDTTVSIVDATFATLIRGERNYSALRVKQMPRSTVSLAVGNVTFLRNTVSVAMTGKMGTTVVGRSSAMSLVNLRSPSIRFSENTVNISVNVGRAVGLWLGDVLLELSSHWFVVERNTMNLLTRKANEKSVGVELYQANWTESRSVVAHNRMNLSSDLSSVALLFGFSGNDRTTWTVHYNDIDLRTVTAPAKANNGSFMDFSKGLWRDTTTNISSNHVIPAAQVHLVALSLIFDKRGVFRKGTLTILNNLFLLNPGGRVIAPPAGTKGTKSSLRGLAVIFVMKCNAIDWDGTPVNASVITETTTAHTAVESPCVWASSSTAPVTCFDQRIPTPLNVSFDTAWTVSQCTFRHPVGATSSRTVGSEPLTIVIHRSHFNNTLSIANLTTSVASFTNGSTFNASDSNFTVVATGKEGYLLTETYGLSFRRIIAVGHRTVIQRCTVHGLRFSSVTLSRSTVDIVHSAIRPVFYFGLPGETAYATAIQLASVMAQNYSRIEVKDSTVGEPRPNVTSKESAPAWWCGVRLFQSTVSQSSVLVLRNVQTGFRSTKRYTSKISFPRAVVILLSSSSFQSNATLDMRNVTARFSATHSFISRTERMTTANSSMSFRQVRLYSSAFSGIEKTTTAALYRTATHTKATGLNLTIDDVVLVGDATLTLWASNFVVTSSRFTVRNLRSGSEKQSRTALLQFRKNSTVTDLSVRASNCTLLLGNRSQSNDTSTVDETRQWSSGLRISEGSSARRLSFVYETDAKTTFRVGSTPVYFVAVLNSSLVNSSLTIRNISLTVEEYSRTAATTAANSSPPTPSGLWYTDSKSSLSNVSLLLDAVNVLSNSSNFTFVSTEGNSSGKAFQFISVNLSKVVYRACGTAVTHKQTQNLSLQPQSRCHVPLDVETGRSPLYFANTSFGQSNVSVSQSDFYIPYSLVNFTGSRWSNGSISIVEGTKINTTAGKSQPSTTASSDGVAFALQNAQFVRSELVFRDAFFHGIASKAVIVCDTTMLALSTWTITNTSNAPLSMQEAKSLKHQTGFFFSRQATFNTSHLILDRCTVYGLRRSAVVVDINDAKQAGKVGITSGSSSSFTLKESSVVVESAGAPACPALELRNTNLNSVRIEGSQMKYNAQDKTGKGGTTDVYTWLRASSSFVSYLRVRHNTVIAQQPTHLLHLALSKKADTRPTSNRNSLNWMIKSNNFTGLSTTNATCYLDIPEGKLKLGIFNNTIAASSTDLVSLFNSTTDTKIELQGNNVSFVKDRRRKPTRVHVFAAGRSSPPSASAYPPIERLSLSVVDNRLRGGGTILGGLTFQHYPNIHYSLIQWERNVFDPGSVVSSIIGMKSLTSALNLTVTIRDLNLTKRSGVSTTLPVVSSPPATWVDALPSLAQTESSLFNLESAMLRSVSVSIDQTNMDSVAGAGFNIRCNPNTASRFNQLNVSRSQFVLQNDTVTENSTHGLLVFGLLDVVPAGRDTSGSNAFRFVCSVVNNMLLTNGIVAGATFDPCRTLSDSPSVSHSKTTTLSLTHTTESTPTVTKSRATSTKTYPTPSVSSSGTRTQTETDTNTLSLRTASPSPTPTLAASRSATLTASASHMKTKSETASATPCFAAALPTVTKVVDIISGVRESVMKTAGLRVTFSVERASEWKGSYATMYANSSRFAVSYVRPSEGRPCVTGFVSVNYTDSSASLQRVNDTAFSVWIPPPAARSFKMEEDEVLRISLSPSYFTACAPTTPIPIGDVVVVWSPPAIVAETAAANAAVTSSTMAVSTGLGAANALDAQTVAVLGMMSCAGPVERGVMKKNRLLSPLATGDSYEAMVIGNLLLLLSVGLLQSVVIVVRVKFFEDSWGEARMFARFPGGFYGVVVLCHQGTAAAAIKVISTSGSEAPHSMLLGSVTLLYSIATPLVVLVVVRRYVSAKFVQYDLQDLPDTGKLKILRGPVRYLLPNGRWEPRKMRKQFGALFSGFQRSELLWSSAALWGPSLMVMGSAFRPSTDSGCVAQFGALAFLQFIVVLLVLVFRPYRSRLMNVLQALSSLSLAILLLGSALSVGDHSDLGSRLVFGALQSQMLITCCRVVYMLLIILVEYKFAQRFPSHPTLQRKGTCVPKKYREESDSEADEDEEMLRVRCDGGDTAWNDLGDPLLLPSPPASSGEILVPPSDSPSSSVESLALPPRRLADPASTFAGFNAADLSDLLVTTAEGDLPGAREEEEDDVAPYANMFLLGDPDGEEEGAVEVSYMDEVCKHSRRMKSIEKKQGVVNGERLYYEEAAQQSFASGVAREAAKARRKSEVESGDKPTVSANNDEFFDLLPPPVPDDKERKQQSQVVSRNPVAAMPPKAETASIQSTPPTSQLVGPPPPLMLPEALEDAKTGLPTSADKYYALPVPPPLVAIPRGQQESSTGTAQRLIITDDDDDDDDIEDLLPPPPPAQYQSSYGCDDDDIEDLLPPSPLGKRGTSFVTKSDLDAL